MIIKKGTLIAFTHGEYSDYRLLTIAKAKQDLDIMALREIYLEAHPNNKGEYNFKRFQFLNWLTQQRLIKELDYCEWLLGTYGEGDFDLTCIDEKDATA
jgi:hypothetical protein